MRDSVCTLSDSELMGFFPCQMWTAATTSVRMEEPARWDSNHMFNISLLFENTALPGNWIGILLRSSPASVFWFQESFRGYQCICQPGFVGRHCEFQRNRCASGPCRNGGRCHALLDSFMCECQPGFTGMTCEVSGGPGYCVVDTAWWVRAHLLGPSFFCLQVQNDPCSPNPCHKQAQCHGLMGDFYCSCPDNYEGKTCSELKDHCKTNQCKGETPSESRRPQILNRHWTEVFLQVF